MKNKLFFLSVILLVFTACSNDDESNNDGTASDSNYFPLAVDNSWNYNNRSEQEGYEPIESNDEIYVSDNTNGNYTIDGDMPMEGLMTSIFANGSMKKDGYQLIYNGSYEFMIDGFQSIQIPLQNVVVYDASASVGTELFSASDIVTQTFNGIPLEIEYTVSTLDEGEMENMEVNGVIYEDVISSKFILTLRITTSVELFGNVEIPILETQDVSVGQNFYAAGVGMIQSDVVFSYELEDLSQYPVELPMEPSATINSTQKLSSYVAVED